MLSARFATAVLCGVFLIVMTGCACRGTGRSAYRTDASAAAAPEEAEARTFRFVYGATITELGPGEKVRVWLPVARSTSEQDVTLVTVEVPGPCRETVEKTYGNPVLYFEATADENGQVPILVEYLVKRNEIVRGFGEPAGAEEHELFLGPSSMVPVDGSTLEALVGDQPPQGEDLAKARALYDAIGVRMRYDKPAGEPWGRGDARWACDARFGNCTDFHSVFIAACRDLNIPAKFEIGFPIPADQGAGEVGGYHCWAKFLSDDRWVAVDISEADKHPEMADYYFGNLTPDRVVFTTGRDLRLDPAPQAGPVNFLIYPYVEVDGRPHTSFIKGFRFQDVE
ncbi:MAG: transglutaminase domain-containing protein [Phycisphaerales bacterium]|nr:MAG: transglutaminase domain-containing protein [Phycisphaerales bacterium]